MKPKKPQLRWSVIHPTHAGWYLFRRAPKAAEIPVRVFDQDGALQLQSWGDIGWFRLDHIQGEFAYLTP